MLRHEFRPGQLVAGLFLTAAGITYAGDAGGAWDTPWFAVIPMVVGGLCLAGVVGLLARAVRRHRDTRRTSTPPEADQPDTAQTQATHRTP
ncbi:hypothetical protein M2164_003490 [Streptomyces sp. SAI-208]|uniref:hypothetical protein n=1 Tax=Streptomyces sp. SAI-208 TaxID=2940550 RepID=UPI00247410C7|nr:hypothetical protein [Streptomyces sp. SAI-208]MDH6607855.1 hypothetical protein [Streptomyces sp. SAI-208]